MSTPKPSWSARRYAVVRSNDERSRTRTPVAQGARKLLLTLPKAPQESPDVKEVRRETCCDYRSIDRHRPGHGETPCVRGYRSCVYHGPSQARLGCCGCRGRKERDRCAGRCCQPGRPRSAVRSRRNDKRKIDIIFANAGVAQLAPIGTVSESFFDRHFDANVKGLFFTVQKGLPLLNDGGAVILTGSIAALKGFPAMKCVQCHQGSHPLLRPHVDERAA